MKRTFLTIVAALLIGLSMMGQGLNENAKDLKEVNPELYNDIKYVVALEWEGDHEMMVFGINQQADAFTKIMEYNNKPDFDKAIYNAAMDEWTVDKKYFDWVMVEFTYTNQIEAKNAY